MRFCRQEAKKAQTGKNVDYLENRKKGFTYMKMKFKIVKIPLP